MALNIRITRRAEHDIADIRAYISKNDQRAAERVRKSIVQAIELLADHPRAGLRADEPGVRIKLVPPFPYRIYYRVMPDAVEILHVRHTSRRVPDPSEVL